MLWWILDSFFFQNMVVALPMDFPSPHYRNGSSRLDHAGKDLGVLRLGPSRPARPLLPGGLRRRLGLAQQPEQLPDAGGLAVGPVLGRFLQLVDRIGVGD